MADKPLITGTDFICVPTPDYERAAQSDASGMEFARHTHPVELHVDDFEGAKAELEERDVEFRGDVVDSGVSWQAHFSDPGGDALAIHHRYAPSA